MKDLMGSTRTQMTAELAKIRAASEHAGVKGQSAEEVLATFLRRHLPASLGVTTGHVVDSYGNRSTQVDVIIYDATRTPALFTSADGGVDVLPAEGVLAVIEVKMHLKSSQLNGVRSNCESVVALARDAYYGDPIPKFLGYGDAWAELPIYYSVFAFESDAMYASKFNEMQREKSLPEHVASICYLDRGVSLPVVLEGGGAVYKSMPTPPGIMVDISTEDALLLWFISLCDVVFQVTTRPIALSRYAADQLVDLGATTDNASPGHETDLVVAMTDHLLGQLGISPGIGKRLYEEGGRLSEDEVRALQEAGVTVTEAPDGKHELEFPFPG